MRGKCAPDRRWLAGEKPGCPGEPQTQQPRSKVPGSRCTPRAKQSQPPAASAGSGAPWRLLVPPSPASLGRDSLFATPSPFLPLPKTRISRTCNFQDPPPHHPSYIPQTPPPKPFSLFLCTASKTASLHPSQSSNPPPHPPNKIKLKKPNQSSRSRSPPYLADFPGRYILCLPAGKFQLQSIPKSQGNRINIGQRGKRLSLPPSLPPPARGCLKRGEKIKGEEEGDWTGPKILKGNN